ncbi:MAG: hypothetical protein NTZ80_03090 [Patescibacteria group bacterium]|nr:hypothetical protein [Patescibacteria group bacterium]
MAIGLNVMRRYIAVFAALSLLFIVLKVSADELINLDSDILSDSANIDVALVSADEIVQLNAGEERNLRAEDSVSWQVQNVEIANGDVISADSLPVGFYELHAGEDVGAQIVKVLTAPPPPSMTSEINPKLMAELVADADEQEIIDMKNKPIPEPKPGEFQIVSASLDTLNQITVNFANIPDIRSVEDPLAYHLYDLDIVNPEITDEAIEYTGAAFDPATSSVNLAISGLVIQPGEKYRLEIYDLAVIIAQPEVEIVPDEEVPAANESDVVLPAAVSLIDTLNQITLASSDLVALGTGVDLTAAGSYVVSDTNKVNPETTDTIEVRGVVNDLGNITLAISGMTEQTGEEYMVTIGNEFESVQITLVMNTGQVEISDKALEIEDGRSGPIDEQLEIGTGAEVIEDVLKNSTNTENGSGSSADNFTKQIIQEEVLVPSASPDQSLGQPAVIEEPVTNEVNVPEAVPSAENNINSDISE